VTGSNDVEKCLNCQFYDRRQARPTDGKAPMWGQCRRHSPHLNTVTTKTHVVEGVWPLVRDDDWCGEWKIVTRTAVDPIPEAIGISADTPTRGRPLPIAAATTVAAGD
jgi:hypothetical protein